MGGVTTDNVREATHLVLDDNERYNDRMKRTLKFLAALCVCPQVVAYDWLGKSISAKRWLPINQAPGSGGGSFVPRHRKFEEKYKFSLKQSLQQRSGRLGELMGGKSFYITKSVLPPPAKMVRQRVHLGRSPAFAR